VGDGAGRGSGPGEAEILGLCRIIVTQVAAHEPAMRALSDSDLTGQTAKFRSRLEAGEDLDALLPEAFATVREASVRALGQRPYDTQIMGGVVLNLGKVAEMRTGEGKTLAATLPGYLHALGGAGVHVLTANEYLAARDAEWMRPLYQLLGMDVGVLAGTDPHGAAVAVRQAAYRADVTYGVAAEFCYDYLRDNTAYYPHWWVQRDRRFAIVDEADLIMIDDARSVAGLNIQVEGGNVPYTDLAALVAQFRPGVHYSRAPDRAEVSLTDDGARAAEERLGLANLYDEASLPIAHGLQKALEAFVLQRRDRDYLVADGTVMQIDAVSGRADPSRAFADGLVQALEAKEGLPIRPPTESMGMIPLNEYLKGYRPLCAMTGTAATDRASYQQIYGLDVVVIPTNRPMIRIDHLDAFYGTAAVKLAALADEVVKRHKTGQPVLVGAGSIEESAAISDLLAERGAVHEVLTAKNNEQEAEVIAGAGRLGAVTVIAKMAGRGVDIVLAGPGATAAQREQVADLGGLCVLGAERYLNRRQELHLRGRAGRQGDPGESKLFASFEDEAAIALFGKDAAARNGRMIRGSGVMTSGLATRAFDTGQATWAERVAQIVKHELDFDAVLAEQRDQVYAQRQQVLFGTDLVSLIRQLVEDVARELVSTSIDRGDTPQQCKAALQRLYPTALNTAQLAKMATARQAGAAWDQLGATVTADALRAHSLREAELGAERMRRAERVMSLGIIDFNWRRHLQEMLALREGIGLRAIGGRSPLAEYRREAGELFTALEVAIRRGMGAGVFRPEAARFADGATSL
jgi:preprotein translocase subunit SecA